MQSHGLPAGWTTERALSYSRLISYATLQYPDFLYPWHIREIARHLEAVERGEIKRLMIFMPPRHGKSMLASEFFPAWYLGRNPGHYVIAASYAAELAEDFGRKVRNQLIDPDFQWVFPGCKIARDSQSSKRFNTLAGGSYFAVGVGGPITGRGAHLLLIDDPVKNREEANSEIIRQRNKDWFRSTAYTRLMPGGAIIIINTRWHEDDLCGWALSELKHEGFVVLSLPAINSHGKALWPEQYDLDRLNQIKSSLGPYEWSALYMQTPTPLDGNFFLRDWWRYYDNRPVHLRIYGASDYAVTDDGGDYTVHLVVGVDPDDNIYILDMWRGQKTSLVWAQAFIDLILKWRPLQWAEENGQISKSIGPLLDRMQRESSAYCYRKGYTSSSDKPSRAQAIRGRVEAGKVYLPKHWEHLDRFIAECLSFPNGKNDDIVDSLGLIGRMLAEMAAAERPPESKKQSEPSIRELVEMQRRKRLRGNE